MALLDRPYGPVTPAANSTTQTALDVQAAQPGPLPVTQVINGTSETLILANGSTAALSVAIPPNTQLEQTPFDLNISGYILTTDASATTITLTLYEGTAIVSGNILKASTATTQTNAKAPFWIKANLIYDSVSGLLCGKVEFYINKVISAAATLTNFPTGVSNANNPVLQFCFSLTASVGTSSFPCTINVQKFSVG